MILKSVKNLINNNIQIINREIIDIDKFISLFQKNIVNYDYYYLLKFINEHNKEIYYIININSIELIDTYDYNFIKIMTNIPLKNNNANTKLLKKLLNIEPIDKDILKSSLLFIDKNSYYIKEINDMIMKEINRGNNILIGGGIIDIINSYNTPFTELLLSILATVPIHESVYNLLNLIIAIKNLDKKGIALSILGFIPGYVGRIIKFGNLIRLSYSYYKNNNISDNYDKTK